MTRRRRLAVVTATIAVLAATGTASAAAAGPAPGPTKPGAVQTEGKDKARADADLAAAAAKLGVSVDRLTAAFVAAKRSLVNAPVVTPDAFAAAVAANLGLPVARVLEVVGPLVTKPDRVDNGKPRAKDGNPQDSPFATDAAAAKLAAELGVDRTAAKAALASLVRLSMSANGLEPTSPGFRAIAVRLGVSPERLMTALVHLKQSLATG